MDEKELGCILKQWAKPDPSFCEELLRQCLSVLDQGEDDADLCDNDLGMLSAAGDAIPNDIMIRGGSLPIS